MQDIIIEVMFLLTHLVNDVINVMLMLLLMIIMIDIWWVFLVIMSLIFIHIKAHKRFLTGRFLVQWIFHKSVCLRIHLFLLSKFTALAHNSHEIEDYKEQSKKNCLKRRKNLKITKKCLTKLTKIQK